MFTVAKENRARDEAAALGISAGDVILDRYRVGNLIGRGGAASVYEALDLKSASLVALKVLHARPRGKQGKRERAALLAEAQHSVRIASPHAVRVYEVGILADERPFLVMERLHGQDAARRLLERGPMSVMETCDIVLQACHSLGEAHRAGTVHRDIKPGNLFLATRQDGAVHVKVLDFGLAIMSSSDLRDGALTPETRTWRVAGSPGYAAPEQLGSQRSVDERADIWGLGIVMYELVLGRRPFDGATLIDTLIAAGSNPLPPFGPVPPAFEAVVRKCLEKDRERRFANVAELADALAPLASPVLADYPELVRLATGIGQSSGADSTQRIMLDDVTEATAISSRASSSLDGPGSSPVSSRGKPNVPPAEASRSDVLQAEGTSAFVAQIVPAQSNPWGAVAALVVAGIFGVSVWVSHAHGATAVMKPKVHEVAPMPTQSAPSMLLPPLPSKQVRGDAPPGWQTDPPVNWEEVP